MSEPTPEPTPAPEPTPTPTPVPVPPATFQAPTPTPTPPPDPAPEPTPAPDPAPAADDDWLDPEKGKEAKRKANQEARKLRGEIEDLKKQIHVLASAPDEAKAAIALVEAESARQVARIKFGHQYGLPDAVVERLRGDSAEEIEADAKAMAVHFNPTAGLGRGGLDPTDEPEETDPKKLAAQIPRRL